MIQLAWRNLFQNVTQFVLGVGGVTLALLLMLALDALLAGSEEDLVAYIEQSGADIYVAQEGVKNMHMSVSAITNGDVRLAARAGGVVSASPILYTSSVIETQNADVLAYIIGFDPREPLGGPPQVVAGSADLRRDEIIIDEAVARAQELTLGDTVEIFGEEFTIVGLTRGLTSIVNSTAFIHVKKFQELRPGEVYSYALLQIEPGSDPAAIAADITARDDDVNALTRADFSREERQIIQDMSTEILNIMNLSGFMIGLAVTALTLYTNTLNKRQEYGVLKAIGSRNSHLYAVVVAQVIISLTLGFGIAISLVWLLGWVLPLVVPQVGLVITPGGLSRVLLASSAIGVIAALAPAWQMARLDPAQVFRG